MFSYDADFQNYHDLALSAEALVDDVISCLDEGYDIDDSMVAFVCRHCLQEEQYETLALIKRLYEKEHGEKTFLKIMNNGKH